MAGELAVDYYGYNSSTNKPSTLLNSIFMWTVNTAAKTLVAVASSAKIENADQRWRAADHLRFMVMLMTWLTVWVLRVLMDYFPFSDRDLVLQEDGCDGPSVKALGRALSHIFALLNDIPASSRKYQFAVAMADKIVDENARNGHLHLLQINRATLASAFSRTAGLLHRSIQTCSQAAVDDSGAWTSRLIGALPLGSYIKGLGSLCLGAIFPNITGTSQLQKQGRLAAASGGEETTGDVVAEKHAHELLWITNKLRACGAVDEALTQWSLASGLASLSLTANPRVQGFMVKISENGLAYPVLTGYEKAEMERTMDEVISTLPAMDQEVILTNWLQDFAISSSDWPNLQMSYDRWCRSTRKLIT
ncbi:hypothetical protein F0562_033091 [Nyssa sinensis]|uniref:Uncharacterized protein n=1 Tax=Nyssa sinensis TaxID=561372 RepID=A0A5J5AU52_9ASTE|nr:hypothetical protein F0562_033091 [Nyssa sinensis]